MIFAGEQHNTNSDDPSTWEGRMSARAFARARARCEDAHDEQVEDTTMLDGAIIRCKGCGLGLGMTTIVILDPTVPVPPPDFPNTIAGCSYTDGLHRRAIALGGIP